MRLALPILTFLLLLTSLQIVAQSTLPDSSTKKTTIITPQQDSVKKQINAPVARMDSLKREIHSPRKASIRSAILPGWGQAYNKKYWKIPIIYVGAAALIYGLKWNHDNYKDFKQLSIYISDQDSSTIPVYNGRVLNEGYANWASGNRDYFRKNRDLCAIGLGALYVLNIIDANVDAHLFEFNINDDLSLKLQPNLWIQQNYMFAGIGATLKLK